jgi:hypothetical protein
MVTMRGLDASRRDRIDLLARPPCVAAMYEPDWVSMIVDPTEQLEALADLFSRGLLSRTEFEQQKARVIER